MDSNQKRLRELRDRQSQQRQRMAELSRLDTLTDEQRTEFDRIEAGVPDLERQLRGAALACETDDQIAEREALETGGATKPEVRARLELRSRATISGFLRHAVGKGPLDGAEGELAQQVHREIRDAGGEGLAGNEIPMEVWDVLGSPEKRAVTPAPTTVGVNLDTLQPAVFAPSIAANMMIDMPMVPSGTYASATISTNLTASAAAKGGDVANTAGAFTPSTATARRIGAAVDLAIEDIVSVGASNFESILREHIPMVLSAELDDQIINGNGTSPNISGLFAQLTNPSAPAAGVEDYDRMLAIALDGIDGLWATKLSHIGLMVGVDTYRLAFKSFRDRVIDVSNDDEADSARAAASLGSESFGHFAEKALAGFMTNERMPAKASHVQAGILCRKGRPGMRTAVLPTWGTIAINDPGYDSMALKGQSRFTVSTMIGSQVILVQPNAYAEVAFRVSTT
ncbi:MAG: phage major capsid protein [Gammaproteobacteria bacterium]|nr:phage major capsid protein [Gammaproteobacteria bacterium]